MPKPDALQYRMYTICSYLVKFIFIFLLFQLCTQNTFNSYTYSSRLHAFRNFITMSIINIHLHTSMWYQYINFNVVKLLDIYERIWLFFYTYIPTYIHILSVIATFNSNTYTSDKQSIYIYEQLQLAR